VRAMSWLQNHPRFLEDAYRGAHAGLQPFRRWLRRGGAVERLFVAGEKLTKGPIFDCQMCGQCILHSTGMTCPMACPKTMRNGPCGGVRPDGHCEIKPDMPCVWLQAWERSKHMPAFGGEILRLQPPVDRRLEGSSAWINEFSGDGARAPVGWGE
jgi:hypothetical protein